jgi:hypothetical protein
MYRRRLAAAFIVALGLLVAIFPDRGSAEPPWADRVLALTSTRIDYAIPSQTVASVARATAIQSARVFVSAPASATALSTRLGFYSDLKTQHVLVWVVDLDGVKLERLAGAYSPGRISATPPPLTQVLVFVSASEPGVVVGYVSSNIK